MVARTFFLVLLIVLSGCAGATDGPQTNGTETTQNGPSAVHEAGPDEPDPDELVKVHLENPANYTLDASEALFHAMDFWEQDPEGLLNDSVELARVSDPGRADLTVEFVDKITYCGYPTNVTVGDLYSETSDTTGCTTSTTGGGPDQIEIVNQFIQSDVNATMAHEFGHALGVGHPNGSSVMEPTAVARPIQKTLTYSIDMRYDDPGSEAQVDYATEFFEKGANGTTQSNLSFKKLSADESVFLRVTVGGDDLCEEDRLGCLTTENYDSWADPVEVVYEEIGPYGLDFAPRPAYEISISNVASEYVGWVTANYLSSILEAHHYLSETPPELDTDASDITGFDWH